MGYWVTGNVIPDYRTGEGIQETDHHRPDHT